MCFRNVARKAKAVFAARNATRREDAAPGPTSITASLLSFFVIGLALIFISKPVISEDAQLNAAITNVSSETAILSASVTTLSQDETTLIQKYHLTNAGQCGLLVVGISTGTAGGVVQVPISFLPSSGATTAVQVDLLISSSFTITGATIGPAGAAAGKSVQISKVGAVTRVLVFGINTTPIGAGILATLTLSSLAGTPKSICPITMTNIVASDAVGNTSLLCGTSGAVQLL
jgi:hypothetical protein